MKLPENNIYSETSSIGSESSFSIGNKGLIFSILRGKLYSDPISSILREYAANAKDANVEAGFPDKPIEIYLPNNFELSLKIKDNGLGITPDRMSNVFINYGNSTKRESNEFQGAFGLGAKVAFSYTNQFSIVTTSDYEGKRVKRTYISYIDPSEEGKMRLVSEEETNEPTGTEIIIAIEKEDKHTFLEKAIKVFAFWPIKPKFFGIHPEPVFFDYDKHVILSGTNWKLLNFNDRSSSAATTKIIIDGVCYDIDTYKVHIKDTKASNVLHNNLLLYFNIGELTLSAGREYLHYDENTIKKITEKLNLVIKETPNLIKESIKNSENYLDANKKFRNILKTIQYIDVPQIDWLGKPLTKTQYLDFGNTNKFFIGTYYYKSSYRSNKDVLSCTSNEKKYGRSFLDMDVPVYIFDLDENKEKSPRSRVKTILASGEDSKTQILKFSNTFSYEDLKKEYLLKSGIDLDWLEPKLLSKIAPTKEVIVRKPAQPKEKGKIYIYKYNNLHTSPRRYSDHYWEPVSIEKDDNSDSLYVVFDSGTYKNIRSYSGFHLSTSDISELSKHFKKDIYAVRDKDVELLSDTWIRFETVLKEHVDKLQTIGISDIDVATINNNQFIINKFITSEIIISLFRKNKSAGPFDDFLAEYDRLKSVENNIKAFKKYYKYKTISDDVFKIEDSELYKLQEKLLTEYPLLKHIRQSMSSFYDDGSEKEYAKKIVDYINLVDNNKTKTIKKAI